MGKEKEEDTAEALQIAVNEMIEAVKPLNLDDRIRVLATVAVFLGVKDSLCARLR